MVVWSKRRTSNLKITSGKRSNSVSSKPLHLLHLLRTGWVQERIRVSFYKQTAFYTIKLNFIWYQLIIYNIGMYVLTKIILMGKATIRTHFLCKFWTSQHQKILWDVITSSNFDNSDQNAVYSNNFFFQF